MTISRLAFAFVGIMVACQISFGQAVQLPSFQFSTVGTTVSVPDGGSALLGGVKRNSMGRTERGVPILGRLPGIGRGFNNRGIGRDSSVGMTSVTTTIIDLREMDEQILGEAAAARLGSTTGPSLPALDPRAAFLTRNVARNEGALMLPGTPSRPGPGTTAARRQPRTLDLDKVQARQDLALQQQQVEAKFFFEKGQHAEANGKKTLAKHYYRMAATRSTGSFKDQVLVRLDVVTGGPKAERIARGDE